MEVNRTALMIAQGGGWHGHDGHVWVCLSLLRHVFEMFVLKRCEGGKGEARQQQAEAPESSRPQRAA